jgi:hypothetical protein
MEPRSAMSEVRFKVRQNALLWREFTAAQMVEITGLKPESVRTELQRMKTEGLLEVGRTPCPADQKRKRGGQLVVYRLTSDPEKRLALSRSVEAFYPGALQPQRPSSRHFALATRLLDQASTEKDAQKRERLLAEAEDELDFALAEEGAGRAPEAVCAHIEFQRGRVAYLRGQDEQAETLLHRASLALVATEQSHQAIVADRLRFCIAARRRWAKENDYRAQVRARCVLEQINGTGFLYDPLVRLLADLLGELAETPQDRVIAATIQSMVAASDAIQQTAERLSQHEQTLSSKIESQEWRSYVGTPELFHIGLGHEDAAVPASHSAPMKPTRGPKQSG